MILMGRGKERTIICSKCGRRTRRDKAVCIQKATLQNPVERKDVQDDQYFFKLTREMCYCASCGKHLRIYDKKIKENERAKERESRGWGYRQYAPPY